MPHGSADEWRDSANFLQQVVIIPKANRIGKKSCQCSCDRNHRFKPLTCLTWYPLYNKCLHESSKTEIIAPFKYHNNLSNVPVKLYWTTHWVLVCAVTLWFHCLWKHGRFALMFCSKQAGISSQIPDTSCLKFFMPFRSTRYSFILSQRTEEQPQHSEWKFGDYFTRRAGDVKSRA